MTCAPSPEREGIFTVTKPGLTTFATPADQIHQHRAENDITMLLKVCNSRPEIPRPVGGSPELAISGTPVLS